MTWQAAKELEDEAQLCLKLDHPNCTYMLGYKATLDNGGLIQIMENCDNGSISDMYVKEGMRFDMQTAWRLARETAVGLSVLHKMGYMHRDIKSQ